MNEIPLPHAQIEAAEAEQLVALLRRIEPLKHILRAGWIDREVAAPESVAAHSWRLAVMAWLTAQAQGLDSARAMLLALVHDMPEAVTGDATPFDELADSPEERRALATQPPDPARWRSPGSREAKATRERLALQDILRYAPAEGAAALQAAWDEYESNSTRESQLVHQLDKLEAYLQGWEYAHTRRLPHRETLNSFRIDTHQLMTDPSTRAILHAIESWADAPDEEAPQSPLTQG